MAHYPIKAELVREDRRNPIAIAAFGILSGLLAAIAVEWLLVLLNSAIYQRWPRFDSWVFLAGLPLLLLCSFGIGRKSKLLAASFCMTALLVWLVLTALLCIALMVCPPD